MVDPIANTITLTLDGKLDGFQPLHIEATITLEPETAPEPPEPTPPPTTDKLRAVIDYEGRAYVFDEIAGVDLGVYREPGGRFCQGCVRVEHPDLTGFVVLFRSDTDGSRDELVFELGDTTVGVVAANMTGYIATISRGPTTLATVEVPEHYWYSRWRWQSAPRPVIASIAELQDAGLLPCFDLSLATTRPLSPARVYDAPMSLAGLTAYVPSTGERDEIGLVTEAQAEYLRGDASADSLLAQAEASGTFPWHFRNETGGGVFDVNTHPTATLYGPTIPWIATPVTLDVAHTPALCYVAYLLTGDVYFLEEQHFSSTYDIISSPPQSREMFSIGKAVRACAWHTRGLARCARVTPEAGCDWIQPRAYWQDWLDRERDWMLSTFVHPTVAPYTEIPYTVFNCLADADGSPASSTLPFGSYTSPWMEDFEAAVLGHVVQMGHEDWRPILEWKIRHCIARTSGTSGWVPAKPSPYNMVMREADKAPYVAGWGECWALNARLQPDYMACDDPLVIPAADGLTYASYCMSALATAATLGCVGAADCYTWLRGQLVANSDANTYIDRKWSFACVTSH
jgi:hypothetical protein